MHGHCYGEFLKTNEVTYFEVVAARNKCSNTYSGFNLKDCLNFVCLIIPHLEKGIIDFVGLRSGSPLLRSRTVIKACCGSRIRD